ncbi:K+ channel tetramerization domain protein [Ancylostoma caninum]|uniref:K+ channel tetramerization domain protein n=1 Tax=Ancylostoma caninum TaxID=29170 RepID=A0A368FRD1_ANCCA|nr:K+ channel tetramerization domain protein [Ancylostoma caninum]
MEGQQPGYSERVKINVGGGKFETSLTTLTRLNGTMLSIMVADRWRGQGELFVDRDPTYFPLVLNYLREGENFIPPSDLDARESLRREAEFYNLPGLVKLCLPEVFHVGDRVQWKANAIEPYWMSFVRCFGCGNEVERCVGAILERDLDDGTVINYENWKPLKHHMPFMKGKITKVHKL